MFGDTAAGPILCAVLLFLLGAFCAQGVKPFGGLVRGILNFFLRLLRIDPNAGREEYSEDEILAMVDMGEEIGNIEQNEKELIENVFEFNNSTAEDIMVHRTDMVLLWTDNTDEEICGVIEGTGLSRFPLCGADADDILGILSTRDYLLNLHREAPRPFAELVRPAYFVPESVRADLLFRDMQSKKVHMAIVVDEYGGTAGLITLEDLLEEIVGNIYDEFDPQEESEIIRLEEGLWRVAGSTELETLGEALGIDLPESEEYDTLGGLIFDRLAVIPEDGSHPEVEAYGLKIRVEKLAERRVEWALVSKADPQDRERPAETAV